MSKYRSLWKCAAAATMMSLLVTGCGGTKVTTTTTTTTTTTVTSGKESSVGLNSGSTSESAGKASAGTSSAAGSSTKASIPASYTQEDNGTWAIYLYICGSDLESDDGDASENLLALMDADRTDDTIILAQTGGASEWQNNFIDADKTQRWLYTDGDMDLVDEQPIADMGDADTLADFLEYASTNYPADHTMVVFWDHGGGTLEGCCFDENYDDDSLSLTDIHDAFSSVYDLSESNPPIDIVGFDCCLMATLDVADTLKDISHFLVASEESEPGCGWNYTAFGNILGANPHITPYNLGIKICDSYYAGLVANDKADTATLSLTDLSQIGQLTTAFGSFVDEMITDAYTYPEYFKSFAISAKSTENYGGNSRAEGYSDLTDIKNFAENTSDYIDSADAVLTALDNCVLYRVNGEYRPDGGGLSFYYDYDGYAAKNDLYKLNGTIDSLNVLYDYGVVGQLNEEESQYMKQLGLDPSSLPDVKTFENYDFGGKPLQMDENGTVYCDFGSDVSTCITDAMYNIYRFQDDQLYWLGTDDEVGGDYDTGVITDNMGGNWGYFDGNLAYMELTYDSDDYNLYSVPIRVDGEKLYLQVAFDYDDQSWNILGARRPGSGTALTSRAEYLEDGTEVTLIQYVMDENNEIVEVDGGTFTYSDDNSFEYAPLEDGTYAIEFLIEDIYTNTAISDYAVFDMADGVKTYR